MKYLKTLMKYYSKRVKYRKTFCEYRIQAVKKLCGKKCNVKIYYKKSMRSIKRGKFVSILI